MSPLLQGPRIVVPPPLVFVAVWVVAWILAQRLPFAIDGDGASTAQEGIGIALVACGLGVITWALVTMVRARTGIMPIRPARALVVHGPYRFSRNPMYVGLTTAYVGLALLLNHAWPLVTLPAGLVVLVFFVIKREERYLRSTFGDAYDRYAQQVRRWL
jgi:protein-S-isoprenylcysteine O-methyltransferase Ste14